MDADDDLISLLEDGGEEEDYQESSADAARRLELETMLTRVGAAFREGLPIPLLEHEIQRLQVRSRLAALDKAASEAIGRLSSLSTDPESLLRARFALDHSDDILEEEGELPPTSPLSSSLPLSRTFHKRPHFHRRDDLPPVCNLTSHFEIVEYTGGVDSTKQDLRVRHIFDNDSDPKKKHLSQISPKSGSWDLILKHNRAPSTFILTHFAVRGPEDSVIGLRGGCVWVWPVDDIPGTREWDFERYTSDFDECIDKEMYDQIIGARGKRGRSSASGTGSGSGTGSFSSKKILRDDQVGSLDGNGFYFEMDPIRLQYDARLNKPLEGSYIHIKFLPTPGLEQVEVFRIVLLGFQEQPGMEYSMPDLWDDPLHAFPHPPLPLRPPLPPVFTLRDEYSSFRRVWNRNWILFVFVENYDVEKTIVELNEVGRLLQSYDAEFRTFITVIPCREDLEAAAKKQEHDDLEALIAAGSTGDAEEQAQAQEAMVAAKETERQHLAIEKRMREILRVESLFEETRDRRVCILLEPLVMNKYKWTEPEYDDRDRLQMKHVLFPNAAVQFANDVLRSRPQKKNYEFFGSAKIPEQPELLWEVREVVFETWKFRVLDESRTVVVLLYVDWSPVCKHMVKILNDLAPLFREHTNDIMFCKYCSETNDLPPSAFQEIRFPLLKLFPKSNKNPGIEYSGAESDRTHLKVLDFILENAEFGEDFKPEEVREEFAEVTRCREAIAEIRATHDRIKGDLIEFGEGYEHADALHLIRAKLFRAYYKDVLDIADRKAILYAHLMTKTAYADRIQHLTKFCRFQRLRGMVTVDNPSDLKNLVQDPENELKLLIMEWHARWFAPSTFMGKHVAAMSDEPEFDQVVFVRIDMAKMVHMRRKRTLFDYPYFEFFTGNVKVGDYHGAVPTELRALIHEHRSRLRVRIDDE